VAISRSGLEAVTTTADGVTRLWDTSPNLDSRSTITESSSVYKVVYSSAGDTIVVSTAQRIARWDVAAGKEILSVMDAVEVFPRFPTQGVSISDDGHIIASPSIDLSSIGVYDATTGALIRTLSSPQEGPHEMTFLPGTHLLAVANQNTRPTVFDLDDETNRLPYLRASERTSPSRWLDSTPDGRLIVTSSQDGTAVVWEATTMEALATFEHGGLFGADVAISPDGQTVAVGLSSGEVELWDVESESLQRTLQGHTGQVFSVRFSPNGSLLASTGTVGTTRLWDTSTWKQIRVFTGNGSSVFDVDFSPDSATLVTAAQDGTIRFHTLDADTLIATARASVTRELTEAECTNYVPDGTCD
jgi:WD40 repeat protein